MRLFSFSDGSISMQLFSYYDDTIKNNCFYDGSIIMQLFSFYGGYIQCNSSLFEMVPFQCNYAFLSISMQVFSYL